MKYDIFISYRRDGGYDTAKHLYDLLSRDGYKVSFDIDTLRSGNFDWQLYERIDQCKDFILIVDEHAFDRAFDPEIDPKNDWLRCELAYALKAKKNIVPIFLSGVEGFPQNLPEDISDVVKRNGPPYNKYYFNDFYNTLKRRFLNSSNKSHIFLWVILFCTIALVTFAFLKFHSRSADTECPNGEIQGELLPIENSGNILETIVDSKEDDIGVLSTDIERSTSESQKDFSLTGKSANDTAIMFISDYSSDGVRYSSNHQETEFTETSHDNLYLDYSSWTFDTDNNYYDFSVHYDGDDTISASTNSVWITASFTSKGKLKISVDSNSGRSRQGKVFVKCRNNSTSITIKQKGYIDCLKCYNPQLGYSTGKLWGIIDYSYVGTQITPQYGWVDCDCCRGTGKIKE